MQRITDIVLSFVALILLSPVLLIVAGALRCSGEGHIFYLQPRVGRNDNVFNVIKFATMLKDSEKMNGGSITAKEDPRILPFGAFLRNTKINELPQLLNVILGDMSLVGPRPLVMKNYHFYDSSTREQISKNRPGLSGIGSIVFRSEEELLFGVTDREQFYKDQISPYKAELERWYSNNNTYKNYVLIIFLTIYVVATSNNKIIWRLIPDVPPIPEYLR